MKRRLALLATSSDLRSVSSSPPLHSPAPPTNITHTHNYNHSGPPADPHPFSVSGARNQWCTRQLELGPGQLGQKGLRGGGGSDILERESNTTKKRLKGRAAKGKTSVVKLVWPFNTLRKKETPPLQRPCLSPTEATTRHNCVCGAFVELPIKAYFQQPLLSFWLVSTHILLHMTHSNGTETDVHALQQGQCKVNNGRWRLFFFV